MHFYRFKSTLYAVFSFRIYLFHIFLPFQILAFNLRKIYKSLKKMDEKKKKINR